MLTEWYPPETKPKRIGWFDTQNFDCGWAYEYRFWFDGEVWRSEEGGYVLCDQNLTWRGMEKQTK